jgi:hypothetical protein
MGKGSKEGEGESAILVEVTVGWRCLYFCWQPLKDLGEIIHHLVPLPHEGFLKKQFDTISCSIIQCERGCPQDKKTRDMTLYTLTSSETCTKDDKEKTALIPLIKIILGTIWR